MQGVFAHEAKLAAKRDKLLIRPGFRERVEELAHAQWREPVIALRLSDDAPGFDVPGRRLDGTVEGKKLVGRFFGNVLRGVGSGVAVVFSLANGADPRGAGGLFKREIRVTGPANAMALELADSLRSVKGAWLVCSPSHLAVVDTGPTTADPADAPTPRIAWHAQKPQAPVLDFRKRTLRWPDGSNFKFVLHGRGEEQHLRRYFEPPATIHWQGFSR